jgi:hypothetical protein
MFEADTMTGVEMEIARTAVPMQGGGMAGCFRPALK